MCLCFLLFVSLTIAPFYVIGQESYGAYAGLPAEGVNGAGIAGNGANSDREGEITRGASIRKAPIAPVAPPRVPLPFSFGEDDEIPGYRKAPPPPTRREVRSEGHNSAVFSAAHRCELSSSAANHSAPDSLLAAPKFKYVEKICLDASLSRGDDKRRVFPAAIGYILVGHVQEVFNAVSLSECIKACLIAESSYGFVCKSMMFYPTDTDQNCLMNSESRYSQSEVFVPEVGEDAFVKNPKALQDQNVHMLYVDMEQPRLPPSPLPLPEDERRRLKDIPLGGRPGKDIDEEWTRWSKCVNSSASMLPEMRHRYQKCHDAKDVRKCPKESVPCRKKYNAFGMRRSRRKAPQQIPPMADERPIALRSETPLG
uniref:Apple domain-containing protein n=1 Tax=Globodera pallida TaxID=36090 RepID=A0A183CL17_GLOPA